MAEGGLRLDSLDAMLAGGDSGPAIVAGKPTDSLLWQVVSGRHAEISMPPKDPLDDADVKVLEKWIAEGARWPHDLISAIGD